MNTCLQTCLPHVPVSGGLGCAGPGWGLEYMELVRGRGGIVPAMGPDSGM